MALAIAAASVIPTIPAAPLIEWASRNMASIASGSEAPLSRASRLLSMRASDSPVSSRAISRISAVGWLTPRSLGSGAAVAVLGDDQPPRLARRGEPQEQTELDDRKDLTAHVAHPQHLSRRAGYRRQLAHLERLDDLPDG